MNKLDLVDNIKQSIATHLDIILLDISRRQGWTVNEVTDIISVDTLVEAVHERFTALRTKNKN